MITTTAEQEPANAPVPTTGRTLPYPVKDCRVTLDIDDNERYKYYFDGGGALIIILFPLVELFYRALKTLASLVLKAVKVSLVLNCFILSI